MIGYFVKIEDEESIEELFFNDYYEAREFAKDMATPYNTVKIIDNKYYVSELVAA